MKLLPTTDDSIMEDGSIPSFWYRGYSYNCPHKLKHHLEPESFTRWINDNENLNRKPIPKPITTDLGANNVYLFTL